MFTSGCMACTTCMPTLFKLIVLLGLPLLSQSVLLRALCTLTNDESTSKLPRGWRNGLRNIHDLLRCEPGKKRKRKSIPGGLSELFDALDLQDDGEDNGDVDFSAVKRAYRELSIKYHPDKQSGDARRFNRVRDAYEILSDPVKVLLYDTGGMEFVKKYERGEELERTENVELDVDVTLDDIFLGTSRNVSYQRRIVCRSCRLEPYLRRCRRCSACPSEVEHQQVWMNNWQYYVKEVKVPSPEWCAKEEKQLAVQIEKGMMIGDKINYESMSSQLAKRVPGNALVTLRLKQHPLFKRVGNDLVVSVSVTLYEALLGFERELEHLDGHIVRFGQISTPTRGCASARSRNGDSRGRHAFARGSSKFRPPHSHVSDRVS